MELSLPFPVFAQRGTMSELREKQKKLQRNPDFFKDTAWINTLNQIAFIYADSYPDSALKLLDGQILRCRKISYSEGESDTYKIVGNAFQTKGNFDVALRYYDSALIIAEKMNYKTALPGILNNIGLAYISLGNYSKALEKFYATLKLSEADNNKFVTSMTFNNIAIVHFFQGKMDEAETFYRKTLAIATEASDTISIVLAYNNIGEVNIEQKRYTEALHNLNLAYALAVRKNIPELLATTNNSLGITYYKLDSLNKSLSQFENALAYSRKQGNNAAICRTLIGLARVQKKSGLLSEGLANGTEALRMAESMGHTQLQRDANEILAGIFEEQGDDKNAFSYYKKFKFYADSLNNFQGQRASATYKADYEFSKKELEFERQNLQQRWITFSALAALFSLGIIAWLINRNRKRLDHAYHDLQTKNAVIEAQRTKAEETLGKLKAAQSQLIQSEKMASLGELTAGIAHEIQNPLNFVNNFSEVNVELSDEIMELLSAGNIEDAKDLVTDIRLNHEKIREHGKRADSIVKSMLQHSRTNSGKKEPTDINLLADEYLRLSYHGMRAKDKSFNALFELIAYPGLPLISVSPQDIGRVLLNLFNNAFYAVNEKKNIVGEDFEPKVVVSTRNENGNAMVVVEDNGMGISTETREKIFQPFFTTKPTGQGTGLGLSLSYDIVVAHGGELHVESEPGSYTRFIIQLPHGT